MERFASITSPTWPGIDGIKHLFVFGDSYSSVGFEPGQYPHPSVDNPLGVPFPGHTWTDDSKGLGNYGLSKKPNWVGHFVTSRQNAPANPIVVFDYAVGGHTVSNMRRQITDEFSTHAASQPEWAPWKENDSLFVVWVGINDCAAPGPHEQVVKRLLGAIDLLYEIGARNFLLIDVPPIDKSPALPDSILEGRPELAETYRKWNSLLHEQTKTFHANPEHSDCTILMYSSYNIFTRVNEEPEKFGFPPGDVKRKGGSMWMDHLHPTSKMHKVIADDLEGFLKAFAAYKSDGPITSL